MAKILIIEDDLDQAELYRLALEHKGHRVVAIVSDFPKDGSWEGEAPDLVILDVRLRGRSGKALIPALREAFPDVRVLILTADPEVAEDATKFGADKGRKKPVGLDELGVMIRLMLGV